MLFPLHPIWVFLNVGLRQDKYLLFKQLLLTGFMQIVIVGNYGIVILQRAPFANIRVPPVWYRHFLVWNSWKFVSRLFFLYVCPTNCLE